MKYGFYFTFDSIALLSKRRTYVKQHKHLKNLTHYKNRRKMTFVIVNFKVRLVII